MLALAGVGSAAPPPKRFTMVYDRKTEPDAFAFIPTPATCELNLVSSNRIVWVRYGGRAGRRGPSSTTVYIQEQVGRKPIQVVKFGGRNLGFRANGRG